MRFVDSVHFELPRAGGGCSNDAWHRELVHKEDGILAPRQLIIPTLPGEGLPSCWPQVSDPAPLR